MPYELMIYLPLIAVCMPILAMIMICFAAEHFWWRSIWALIGSAGCLAAVGMMYPLIAEGQTITLALPMIITPFNLFFRIDHFGFLIALLFSFVWLFSTVFALSYMDHEKNQGRFFIFFMLTLAGTIGVPLAGDLLTLLIFFEVMSLASYILVVHNQTREAFKAGNLYLYLGIFGGMCLLTGMGLFYFNCGSLAIAPQPCLLEGLNVYLIVAGILMMLGFGIKAGMAPLHIWLPQAHPVAPAPASALLSGIMIKTGAYGMIRVLNLVFTPDREALALESMATAVSALWAQVSAAGYIVIWIGIVTMFFGVCMALLQNNIKKMLACSSISQIGYIVMGIGVAAYLGYEGAMGIAGATYHIFNHAFFKSTLFLAAGAIVYLTGELDMKKLGGLKDKMPFTAVVVLIASLGIVGMPLFNGYAGKTLLHHAIVEAYEHHHLMSLYVAEKIFTLTSAGTVFYFLKFLFFTFWRPAPEGLNEIKPEPLMMKIGMGALALTMLVVGLAPKSVLTNLIAPSLNGFVLDEYLVNYIFKINLWYPQDLLAVAIALGLGALFFYLSHRYNLFRFSPKLPEWVGLEFYGVMVGKMAVGAWNMIAIPVTNFQQNTGTAINRIYRNLFFLLQSVDYRPGESSFFRTFNIRNIETNMLLILIALTTILIVVFYIRFGTQIFGF